MGFTAGVAVKDAPQQHKPQAHTDLKVSNAVCLSGNADSERSKGAQCTTYSNCYWRSAV